MHNIEFEFRPGMFFPKKAGCFTVLLMMFCDYVFGGIPHGAVGWSAVCDCGIS